MPNHFHYAFRGNFAGFINRGSNLNANNYASFGTFTGGGWEAYNISARGEEANVGKTSNTGAGQSHENRPPYYALCYIINATGVGGSGGNSSSQAKAYVSFSGTSNTGNGGTCTIRDSFNVTSVTYNNTGHYTVNFATNFADTNYVTVVGHSINPNNGSTHGILYTDSPQVDKIQLYNCADNASSNLVDKDEVSIVVYRT